MKRNKEINYSEVLNFIQEEKLSSGKLNALKKALATKEQPDAGAWVPLAFKECKVPSSVYAL